MAFYTRAQWGAAAPRGTGNALGDPTGVTVHWEGPKIGSRPASQCAALVRSIQAFHQNGRGWSDIAYNLVVCEHGDVFEGRGASRGNAANGTDAGNRSRYSVCALVGQGDPTPDALKAGVLDAVAYLRRASGRALPTVDCHSDWFNTSCPGPELRAWVKGGAGRPSGDPASPIPNLPAPKPAPAPQPAPKPTGPLTVDGVMGPATIRQWQKVMGTPVDGVISKPSLLVRKVQSRVGVTQDGYLGPQTWRAIQRRLGVSADGIPGPITIKALQRRLNGGSF